MRLYHPRWGELRWFQHLEIQGYGGCWRLLEMIRLGLGCWRLWWTYHVLEAFLNKIARRPTQAIEFRWSSPATTVMNVSVIIYNEITLVPFLQIQMKIDPLLLVTPTGLSLGVFWHELCSFGQFTAHFFQSENWLGGVPHIHMSSMARLKPTRNWVQGTS